MSLPSNIRASPRLKDAEIPVGSHDALYRQLVLAVRTLFHVCKLVHADLSEYNLLYHRGQLAIIDVSQSVEHDHPHAFDFLRSDVRNIEGFFSRAGVRGLGSRRCFEFITRDDVLGSRESESLSDMSPAEGEAQALERWLAQVAEQDEDDENVDEDGGVSGSKDADARAHEDEVFLRSYIPRTLNEVYDPERDVGVLARGEGKNLIYADTIGIVDQSHPVTNGHAEGDSKGTDEVDEEDEEEAIEEDTEDKPFEPRQPRGHRNEDKEAKKVSSSPFMNISHFTRPLSG
jgi:RIO kinase 1